MELYTNLIFETDGKMNSSDLLRSNCSDLSSSDSHNLSIHHEVLLLTIKMPIKNNTHSFLRRDPSPKPKIKSYVHVAN